MQPMRVILDTDPGIDDALAILFALASPEIDLLAVTVTGGNCPLEQGVQNALAILELAGATHIPVAAGVGLPLLRPAYTAPETHGNTGLGYARLAAPAHEPITTHAVDLLIETILAHPGEVTLVAVAPLTNLAIALRKQPRIAQAVQRVIIMGGALQTLGNTGPGQLAEFNVFVDPHAAQIVLHSGMPITLLPWDITRDVLIYSAEIEALLRTGSPIAHFVADATRFYFDFHRSHFGFDGCSMNDPAALALAFEPELATLAPAFVDVELASPITLGRTVTWFTPHPQQPHPNLQAVIGFERQRFIDLLLQRLTALCLRNSPG